ncbi:MAG: GAF domain-containing protein [Anaerolineales bacterium]|nr:GAF domain-containing protein [Anaerolineales bacterium]
MDLKEIKVLIIEDNPGDIRLYREMLSSEDPDRWKLDESRTLEDALNKLTRHEYDLIALDLSLPDSQGLETFHRLKRINEDTPVVILTGRDNPAVDLTAVQSGAQDFLHKEKLSPYLISRSFLYAIERYQLNKALVELSLRDDLTGLLNRRGFVTLGEQQLKQAVRSRDTLTLFFVDINGLKNINDNFGHKEGDLAIQAAARVLQGAFRESDVIARMGGDEFAVLAAGAERDHQAIISRRLGEQLESISRKMDLPFRLSLSLGAAVWKPGQNRNLEELFKVADRAMYAHKIDQNQVPSSGNRVIYPVGEMPPFIPDGMDLLLIEDNPGDARLVKEFLRVTRKEIRITHVQKMAEVRELQGLKFFSVILLDLSLPDSQGINSVKAVQHLFPAVPVVVFTGRNDSQTAAKVLQAGAQDYLIKGQFDENLLEKSLAYAVERHALYQRNQSYLLEIKKSEEIKQSIFDRAEIGIYRVNSRGLVTFANRALLEILGYESLTDFSGKVFFEEHFQFSESLIQRLFAGEESLSGKTDLIYTKEGQSLPVRIGSTLSIVDGEPIIQGTIEDISAAVESERQIRMQASALNAAANAIMITDDEGSILWTNPAFTDLTGYEEEEILGKTPGFLKSGRQDDDFYSQFWATIKAGNVWQGEMVNRKKNGSLYTERMTVTPLKDDQGEVSRFIAVKEDITAFIEDQKLLERRFKEVDILKNVATAGIEENDEDSLINKVTDIVGNAFFPDHFGVLLTTEDKNSLYIHPGYQGIPEEMLGKEVSFQWGVVGRVARTGQAELITDVTRDQDYVAVNPEIKSELCVPIKRENELLGVINAESSQPQAFSPDDARLLTTIAGQLALAVSNLRSQVLEHRQRQVAEMLSEIALTLNSSLEIDQLLDQILDSIAGLIPYESASLILYREGVGQTLRHRGYRERGLEEWMDDFSIQLDQPKFRSHETMFQELEPVLIKDTAQDPDWEVYPETSWIRSYLGIPISKNGKLIGVINLDHSRANAFSEHFVDILSALANQMANALENAQLYRQQKRQVDFLESLRQIDFAITGSMDLQVTLEVILMEVMNQLRVDAVQVMLYDQRSYMLEPAASRGFKFPKSSWDDLHLDGILPGKIIQNREPLGLEGAELAKYPLIRKEMFESEGFQGYYGLPLIAKGNVVGVMELFWSRSFVPDVEWKNYAETVATQTAIAVDNSQLFGELQQANREISLAYDSTLEGWAGALELRDHETEGHSRRVVDLTMILAREMNLPKPQWIHVRRGALLHDIGKMGVPDRILQKPGPLTEQEWELMHKHPLYAERWLGPIKYLKPALDIPLYHHERWDGTGYPYGLKGDNIPLVARIFAVVDVWDALLSDRPYRDAWPREKVVEHIREESGKHFDPQVVESFLEAVADIQF